MSLKSLRGSAVLLTAMTMTIALFQNCTKAPGSASTLSSKSQIDSQLIQDGGAGAANGTGSVQTGAAAMGGGDGYDGKPYVNRLLRGVCADGTNVNSTIYVKDNQAQLVRDDCKPIAPVKLNIASLDLLPHNERNLIFEDGVYDLEEAKVKPTSFLCRHRVVDGDGEKPQLEASDAVIKFLGNNMFSGNIIMALYPDQTFNGDPAVFMTGESSYKQTYLNGAGPDTDTQVFDQVFTGKYGTYGTFKLSITGKDFSSRGNERESMYGYLEYTKRDPTLADIFQALGTVIGWLAGNNTDPKLIPSFQMEMDCNRQ